jgi:hypothetical protein
VSCAPPQRVDVPHQLFGSRGSETTNAILIHPAQEGLRQGAAGCVAKCWTGLRHHFFAPTFLTTFIIAVLHVSPLWRWITAWALTNTVPAWVRSESLLEHCQFPRQRMYSETTRLGGNVATNVAFIEAQTCLAQPINQKRGRQCENDPAGLVTKSEGV